MRKLVVSEFLTLDGVMETPEKWSFPFQDEETAKFKHEELFGCLRANCWKLPEGRNSGITQAFPGNGGSDDSDLAQSPALYPDLPGAVFADLVAVG